MTLGTSLCNLMEVNLEIVLLLFLLAVLLVSCCPPSALSTTLSSLVCPLDISFMLLTVLCHPGGAALSDQQHEIPPQATTSGETSGNVNQGWLKEKHSLTPVVLRMWSWFTNIAASWLYRLLSQRCDGLWGSCIHFSSFTVYFHICWHFHHQKNTLICSCFLWNLICVMEQLQVFQLLPKKAGNYKDY